MPKFMIGAVPISRLRGDQDFEERETLLPNERLSGLDLVLVDDDPMIRELWEFDAIQVGKKVIAVESFNDLDWNDIRNIAIYVDKNLKDGASGFEVAKTLHKQGFQNIYITTGENKDKYSYGLHQKR